jgi:hypothetical protein
MHLNPQQKQALDHGDPVLLVIDNTECVVIRKDVYEQGQDDFHPSETYPAIEKLLDREEDPGLDHYQRYKK